LTFVSVAAAAADQQEDNAAAADAEEGQDEASASPAASPAGVAVDPATLPNFVVSTTGKKTWSQPSLMCYRFIAVRKPDL
jgi:hypothetical protein